jgi:hypothetical protein
VAFSGQVVTGPVPLLSDSSSAKGVHGIKSEVWDFQEELSMEEK